MMGRSHHGMMLCSVAGLSIVGAVALFSMFSIMPPRKQREIKKGLRKAVDDLNELVEDISDTVKSMQCSS